MNKWITIIEEARNTCIPKKKYKTNIYYKNSDLLNLIMMAYKRVQETAMRDGMTNETRIVIRELQEELKQESWRLINEAWEGKMAQIDMNYNDQKGFWSRIKRLMGGKTPSPPYIKNEQGEKVYEIEEKLEEFRKTWKKIFRINPQDNEEFDKDHEEEIEEVIRNSEDRLKIYDKIDLTRLDPNNYLTAPVEEEDVKRIIKRFKHKAPGKTQINKAILERLPDPAFEYYSSSILLTEI